MSGHDVRMTEQETKALIKEAVGEALEPYRESLEWISDLHRVGGWIGKVVGILVLAIVAKAGWDIWALLKGLFK